MVNKEDEFPDPSTTDKIIEYAKPAATAAGVLGSILTNVPGLSILTTELFSRVITPSVDKRRSAWLNSLSQRLEEVETKVEGFKIDSLIENDMFITTMLQATQVAIRTHHQEKLQSLRNAVINTAMQVDPNEDELMMFLNYIDIFTSWHLRIFNFLQTKSILVGYDPENMPKDPVCLTGGILEKEYPELKGKFDFYSQIVNDLFDRGLITDGSKKTLLLWKDDGNKMTGDFITPKGRRFIRYISDNYI